MAKPAFAERIPEKEVSVTRPHPDKFMLEDFVIDMGDNTITKDGKVRHVEPKAMQVLSVLVEYSGHTVSRDYLLITLWEGRVVVEEVLTRAVSQLRDVLDDSRARRLIQTVPKRGYRLTVEPQSTLPDDDNKESGKAAKDTAVTPFWLPLVFVGMIVLAVILGTYTGELDETPPGFAPARLAVLPMNTAALTDSQAQLILGLTEDLTSELASISALQLATGYSFDGDMPEEQRLQLLAERLNVRYVLTSDLRTSGEGTRAVVSLVDVRDNSLLWRGSYDNVFSQLNAVKQSVLQTVLEKLSVTGHEAQITTTPDPIAYKHYLSGRYWLMNGTTSEWFFRAEQAFQQAIAVSPSMAEAHAALAYIYARHSFHDRYLPASQATRQAEREIARALAINPAATAAHQARAILATQRGDFKKAEQALELIIKKQGEDATTQYLYSELELARLNPDKALTRAQRAVQLDPLSQWGNVNLAIVRIWRGEYEAAEQALETALSVDKRYTWAYVWQAKLRQLQGDLAGAITAMQACLDVDNRSTLNNLYLAALLMESGETQRAVHFFSQAASLSGDSSTARLWQSAPRFIYQRADQQTAIELLEKADKVEFSVVSFVPALTALYIETDQVSRGLDWLETYTGNTLAPRPNNWSLVQARVALLTEQSGNTGVILNAAKEQLRHLRQAYPAHAARDGIATMPSLTKRVEGKAEAPTP